MTTAHTHYLAAVEQSYEAMAWTFPELVEMAREVAGRKASVSEFALCRRDRDRVRAMARRIRVLRKGRKAA